MSYKYHQIKKLLVIFISTFLIIISCEYINDKKVIDITSYETEVIENGINGIKLEASVYPLKLGKLKPSYIMGLFFFDENKKQIRANEVKDILKKPYIKDLFYMSSGKGFLGHYRQVVYTERDIKASYKFFIPYDVLPFYMDYLTSKKEKVFFVRLDLFFEGKRLHESDYFKITLK